MRKIFTLFSIVILFGKIASAQDLSVTAITAPVSGCALSTTENVTIRIFNFGPTLVAGSSFNASYTINAGVPVTEMVVLGSNLATNSTMFYTFTTQANLSVPGSYTVDATVTLPGDVNPSNDAFTGYNVVNVAPSVGGTVSGGTNVCTGANSGTLTLSGHTGNVLNWEYSVDGGTTWISISNTTTTQSYNNLTVPTAYRAQVQNGGCTSALSSIATMTIDPVSVGGSVTGSATVCSGSNSGVLNSTGRTGAITMWQFSTDGGVTWTPIANTSATQSYTNLTVTTRYRVQVQSGACSPVFSTVGTITVSPNTVGGAVTGGVTACSGSNGGNLTLSGHTGAVVRWEFSTNAGATWTNISNTTTTQTYLNLTATRWYRALVKSGACPNVYSTPDSIVVVPSSVAGTPGPSATVCSGMNSGTITLTGYAGSINYWQFSTDGGATYTNIANTTAVQNYLNLTTTTLYRANVSNGSCPAANSSTVTISVNPMSVGGMLAPTDTVCSGTNSGTITLSGHTGSVLNWESSTDGLVWTTIANTTTSQNYLNLVNTTFYRAIVKSGVCVSDTSGIDTIRVDVPSVGGSISGSTNVCYGSNSGTLTLSGQTGNVVRWESSIDGGINWTSISNTTTSHSYANLILTTIYRAIIQNGSCSQAISATATITVDPVSVGGTLNGSTTACGGANSGTMDLISYVGTILNWESSTDGGATWTTIANTTATENYVNVLTTTMYRVLVKSGSCGVDTSSIATITVDTPSAGGTLVMSDTVCASSNFGTLTLAGHSGTIQHWESSSDGGLTWLTLANTSATQTYLNLAQSTSYRVSVKSGVCSAATSNIVTITVDPAAIGGSVTGGTTVCDTVNSGVLTLSGYSGNIAGWESSVDGGSSWMPLSNTSPTLNYTNLTDTTWFRVIISSGTCGGDTSSVATVIVNPATVAGTIAANDTVCAGSNNGTLLLSGFTGSIVGWEASADGGFNWTPISNTTDSLVYNNLSVTMMYRAIVKSGICASMTTVPVTITVTPLTVAGTISGATPGCEGMNGGVLTLSGYTGSVTGWNSSTDGGMTWTPIPNTTDGQNYMNLTDTTWYNAIVQSGTCAADTAASAVVIVYPKPVNMIAADTVCEGTATSFSNTSTISSGFIQFYQWSFGDGNNSLSVSPTHTYANAGSYTASLTTTSNFGCRDTATVTVVVDALPNATIAASGALQFCAGDSVVLSAAAGSFSYLWSNGATTPSITVNATGTYTLTITNTVTGCSASDSVDVLVFPSATVSAGNDTTLSLGGSIMLNGTGSGIISWNWFPNTGLTNASVANPEASPVETTTYQLTGTDINGCSDQDSVTITVIADYNVMISNLMTPNDDGYNDRWVIQNIENYPNTEVIVVNREGQEVFSSDSYDNNWDGTNKYGKPLPDGTYYYILKFPDNEEKVYKGSITILKQK